MNINRRQTRCSYCKMYGHNIRTCAERVMLADIPAVPEVVAVRTAVPAVDIPEVVAVRTAVPAIRINIPAVEIPEIAFMPVTPPFRPIPRPAPFTLNIKNNISRQPVECSICMNIHDKKNIVETNCKHKFCGTCIITSLQHRLTCPLCRTGVTEIYYNRKMKRSYFYEMFRLVRNTYRKMGLFANTSLDVEL